MKKILSLSIMLMFLLMTVSSTTGIYVEKHSFLANLNGNTLYVGGSGPGNYTSIQEAINDSEDGDTVFVYDDSSPYIENITITKSIKLLGEDRDTTIIEGNESNNVVYVVNDNANISSFTIHGGIRVLANSTTISLNIVFKQLGDCVYIGNYQKNVTYFNNTIKDNILISNSNVVTIEKSHFNHIVENDIDAGGPGFHGILLEDSKRSIVIRNIIVDCIFGVVMINGKNTIITENTISSSVAGIFLWGYPKSKNCSLNIISRNNISSDNLSIYLDNASLNNIFDNNFYSNSLPAYFWGSLNKWSRNYWNEPRIFPKIIFGQIKIGSKWIPWFNIDWRPAKEPYNIGG